MKKKNNKSTKAALISTIVVVAVVGISVFSLHSLANGKNDEGLKLATVADAGAAENTNTSRLLSRLDADTAEYVVVDTPAAPEVPVVEEVVYEEPVAQVVQGIVGDLVVVDSVVDVVEEPVYDEPAYEEPVYEEPVYEEPVYQVAYEEPDYDYYEPVYEEPVYYEEPVWDVAYVEPDYEVADLVVFDNTISDDYNYGYDDYQDDNTWEDNSYDDYQQDDYNYADDNSGDYYEENNTWEDNSNDYYEEDNNDYYEEDYSYTPSNASLGQQIVNYASAYVGVTPYVWAGNSLEYGTDCSGFTNLIYSAFGIWVPRGSDAYQGMANISYDELLPGDIVVYRYGGHVAIYAGNDTIIHCANEDAGTIYSTMWYSTPTAYVRVVY